MNSVIAGQQVLLLLHCMVGTALADCGSPKLTTPTGTTIAETRPEIRWSAVAGATAYAVKVQSRVPEGRLVGAFDTVVTDTQFMPPMALADERAKVTVSVAARCNGHSGNTVSGWFLIDATALCPAPSALGIRREVRRNVVEWRPTQDATVYEIRWHAPLDGQVLAQVDTREPRAVVDAAWPDGTVLSVRPRCAHGFGEAALEFVTN
jgi:hypothetical protein